MVARDRAQQRHDPVEPQGEEGRERRALGLGDLEDHQAPSGPQDPGQLADAGVEVGEVAHPEADRDRVEGGVVVGQVERVGPLELHRRVAAGAGRPPCRGPARASARRSRSPPPGRTGRPRAPARARGRRCRSRRRGRRRPRRGPRARPPAHASGGRARRSSRGSCGRTRRRCGRTSTAPRWRTPGCRAPGAPRPASGPSAFVLALERGEEVHQGVELLLRQVRVGRHHAGGVGQGPARSPPAAASRRSRSARARGRRCRSRRTCGRPGSPIAPRPARPARIRLRLLSVDLGRRTG